MLKELAGLFLGECPQRMAEIRRAIDERDASGLQQAAHCPQGVGGQLRGPRRPFEAAGRLETGGRDQDWGESEPDWAALEEAIGRARAGLRRARPGGGVVAATGDRAGMRPAQVVRPRRGGADGPGSAREHEPDGRPARRARSRIKAVACLGGVSLERGVPAVEIHDYILEADNVVWVDVAGSGAGGDRHADRRVRPPPPGAGGRGPTASDVRRRTSSRDTCCS